MLIIAGTVTFDAAYQDRMIDAAQAVAEATRTEAGCVSYEFFGDLTEPGRFLLFEEWEDEASLLAHFETPHLAAFYEVLRSSGVTSRQITRYDVSSYGPNRVPGAPT